MNRIDTHCPHCRINKINPSKRLEFETLKEYLDLARRFLASNVRRSYPNYSEILDSEDIIANLATELMCAEISSDTINNIWGYRKLVTIRFIRDYVQRVKTKRYKHPSLDDSKILFKSSEKTPDQNLSEKESETDFKKILSVVNLSEKQSHYLKLYFFDGLSKASIARKYSVSPSSVWKNINKGIKCLKQHYLLEK